MITILGIDPGSRFLGYGALKVEKNAGLSYSTSGVLDLSKEDDFFERLKRIGLFTTKIMEEIRPDFLAIEGLIHVKNVNSLAKLSQARGALLTSAAQLLPKGRIFEFSPNLIKSTLTGHGHADKEGVQKALSWYFDVPPFIRNDESDALAIAFCFIALQSGFPLKMRRQASRSP
jgi:crossover junction endodeoxyribonuclease RuvC